MTGVHLPQRASDPHDAVAAPRQGRSFQVGHWALPLTAFLAFAVFAGTLTYELVWDDRLMLEQTARVRSLGQIAEFFRTDFTDLTSGAIEGQYYRPMLAVSLALDASLWGLRAEGFHLTNVLLHGCVTLLVAVLVRSLHGGFPAALIAALLFAIHPVHVEAVAWIAARQELLLSLGVLGALVGYRRWIRVGAFRWGVLALIACAFALLSKEVAVTLPALLVLSDRLCPSKAAPEHGAWRLTLYRTLPFWGLAATLLAFRLSALGELAAHALGNGGMLARLPGALETLARYALLCVLPIHMTPIYALPRPTTVLALWPGLGVVTLAVLCALAVWGRRREPLLGFGILWFLVTISPVVDLVPIALREMALTDRYLYLPTVGVCVAMGYGFARAFEVRERDKVWRSTGYAALGAVLVFYGWSLLHYLPVWRNDLTLYGRMVEVAPASPMTNYNLGLAHLRAGEPEPAVPLLERAMQLDRRLTRPRTVLALLYVSRGRAAEGFRLFDAVAATGHMERDYFASRAYAHLLVGESAEAVAVAEEGIRRFPGDAALFLRRGQALRQEGRVADAEAALRDALRHHPNLAQAEEELGALAATAGRSAEARRHFLRAAALRPDRAEPLRALALLAEAEGNQTESLLHWRQVLSLAPEGPLAREAADRIRRSGQPSAGAEPHRMPDRP